MDGRIGAIRYLASREAQERYIVNGTASEYLLPEELVNDALDFARLAESGNIGSSLTLLQRDRLAGLKVALEASRLDLLNNDLVARDPAWAEVRRAAQQFLAAYDATGDPPAG